MLKQKKEILWIRAFGVLVILWGILLTYKVIFTQIIMINKFGYDGIKLFDISVVLCFIASGVGLLLLKTWSRYIVFCCALYFLYGIIGRFITFGISGEELNSVLNLTVAGSLIWFYNSNTTKKHLTYSELQNQSKFQQKLTALPKQSLILFSTVSIVTTVIWGWFWIKTDGHKIPKLKNATYTAKEKSFYDIDYFHSQLPFKFTMEIPNSFVVTLVSNKNSTDSVFLTSKEKGLIIMSNLAWFSPETSGEFYPFINFKTPYSFAKKRFSERYGMIFSVLNSLTRNAFALEQAEINNLRGFIQKSEIKGSLLNEIHLFHEDEEIGHLIIKIRKNEEGLTQKEIDEIISTIKFREQKTKSAQEYFKEGVYLFNQQEFEKAKFAFASAVCIDWQHPEYHYYLGWVFEKTTPRQMNLTTKHLKQALALKPDYPEAQQLLNKVNQQDKHNKHIQ